MLSETQRAIKIAIEHGADEAEAFTSSNTVTTIRIASRRIVETKRVRDSGIGVCATIGKKVGYSSGNELTEELVKRAMIIARAKPPNPNFNGFPGPRKAKKVKGIYDRNLENITGSKTVELAEATLQNALDFDKRVVEASGAINLVAEHCAVSNTNGVQTTDRQTKIFGHITVEAQDLDRSEGQGWLGSTTLNKFKPESIGRQAAELAIKSLDARTATAGLYDVILEPNAAAELFYHVLSYAINGRNVYDRMSYFGNSLGKVVAPRAVNVDDWGSMPTGLSSKTIDDEGSPTQKTPLIREGRLVNFIYDWYYGGLARKKSTGNGLRLGDFGRSHQLSPTPYITNLVVGPGDFSREELIEDIDNGLLLSRIWYTYPITPQLGDFSTTSRCGFFISNGEVQGAIGQVRIHENLPKLLKRLDGIGKTQVQMIPWGASASVCTPSIRFRGVRIT
ncbi:MAG: TldD/PmbA family protein [Methanobacteriota archaeon]